VPKLLGEFSFDRGSRFPWRIRTMQRKQNWNEMNQIEKPATVLLQTDREPQNRTEQIWATVWRHQVWSTYIHISHGSSHEYMNKCGSNAGWLTCSLPNWKTLRARTEWGFRLNVECVPSAAIWALNNGVNGGHLSIPIPISTSTSSSQHPTAIRQEILFQGFTALDDIESTTTGRPGRDIPWPGVELFLANNI